MFIKHLTLAFCAGSLFTGCIINTGDTDTDTNTTNTTPGTSGNTETGGDGTTAEQPTTGGTGSATDVLTSGSTGDPTGATEPETTDAPTTSGTSVSTGTTTDDMTTGTNVGCGWAERGKYYACAPEGVPGLEDPEMIDPIACPDGIEAGAPCTDMDGPVNSIGCCNGDLLYFCDNEAIFLQDCTMP